MCPRAKSSTTSDPPSPAPQILLPKERISPTGCRVLPESVNKKITGDFIMRELVYAGFMALDGIVDSPGGTGTTC